MSSLGNLDLETVAEIERLAMRSWPALERWVVGGWHFRYAHGITRRANSIWPGEWSGDASLDACVAEVEEFYRGRGEIPRFQICPASQPPDLDRFLDDRGYRAAARTAVQSVSMSRLLDQLQNRVAMEIELTSQATQAWWTCYAEADEVAPGSVAVRQQICSTIAPPTAYAVVSRQGKAIAVGSAVVEDGWVGFFNIATLPEYRRMGAAKTVLAALAQWGEAHGADRAYLQVMDENTVALRLYERLGFTTGYKYHYRERMANVPGV